MVPMLTDEDVIKALRGAIRGHGSQTKLAEKVPCAVGILNDILHGRRPPRHPRLLKLLGFEYRTELVRITKPVTGLSGKAARRGRAN